MPPKKKNISISTLPFQPLPHTYSHHSPQNYISASHTLNKTCIYQSIGVSPLRRKNQDVHQQLSPLSSSYSAKFVNTPFDRIHNHRHRSRKGKENVSDIIQHSPFEKKDRTNVQHSKAGFRCHQQMLVQSVAQISRGKQNKMVNGQNESQEISFKNLIQNRCKTPKDHVNRSVAEPHSNTNVNEKFKDNNFFRSAFQKKDTQRIRLTQNSVSQKKNNNYSEFYCVNKDGKQAKYQVVGQQHLDQELYYCSRCTISLVQQGFILEEINTVKRQSKSSYWNDLNEKKGELIRQLSDLGRRELDELNTVNKYYNGLMNKLEELRNQDALRVRKQFEKREKIINQLVSELDDWLSQGNWEEFMKEELKMKEQLFSQLKSRQNNVFIEDTLIEAFIQQFQLHFRPIIPTLDFSSFQNHSSSTSQGDQSKVSESTIQNNAMRFSFQRHQPHKINSLIDPVHTHEQSGQHSKSQVLGHKSPAFRHLFPQDEDSLQLKSDVSSPTFKNI